jgi:hypothetical protein
VEADAEADHDAAAKAVADEEADVKPAWQAFTLGSGWVSWPQVPYA